MKRKIMVVIVVISMIYSCGGPVENNNNDKKQSLTDTQAEVEVKDSTTVRIEKVTKEIKESSDELDKLLKDL